MKLSFSTFVTVMVFGFTISAAERKPEPIGDPIPSKIEKGEIRVALENFVRVPETAESASPVQTNSAYARIQYMTPLPDDSGRLVINDLRGVLYLTDEDGSEPAVYLDLRDEDVDFDDSTFPNETGLAGVAFHPNFAREGQPGFGKFYTAYSAPSDSGVANYLESKADNHESVIREWSTCLLYTSDAADEL